MRVWCPGRERLELNRVGRPLWYAVVRQVREVDVLLTDEALAGGIVCCPVSGFSDKLSMFRATHHWVGEQLKPFHCWT